LAFLANFTAALYILKLELQNRDKHLAYMIATVNGVKSKLLL
jgi:hypothetical protein